MSQAPPDISKVARDIKELPNLLTKPSAFTKASLQQVFGELAGALIDIDRRLRELEQRDQK